MENVMIDNWFMEEVLADIHDGKIHRSISYADLLMAIVLWDNVYYPQNDYNWWNSIPSQVQNLLHPIYDKKEKGKDESVQLLYKNNNMTEDDLYWLKWKGLTLLDSKDIVGSGAIRYLILSSNNGCDYFPCEKRHEFLLQYSSPQKIQTVLVRMKMQGELDKTIDEYYSETYKSLVDFSKLKLDMPVLVNFIFDNTPEGMTPIDFALHLKNEGAVIKYRAYLRQVEDALEQQRWKDLRFLLQCSTDAVDAIISLDRKHIGSIEFNILPTPTVLIKYQNLTASIFPTPVLKINKICGKISKKIHLTFLKQLTKYAINELHW